MRMGDAQGPQPGSIIEAFETLVDLQQEGLIRHLGVSNVTGEQRSTKYLASHIIDATFTWSAT